MVQHISIETLKLNKAYRLWNAQIQRSFSISSRSEMDGYFITQNERSIKNMKKKLKRLLTGMLTLATVFTTLPASTVHASEKQYWTDAEEKMCIRDSITALKQTSFTKKKRGLSSPKQIIRNSTSLCRWS